MSVSHEVARHWRLRKVLLNPMEQALVLGEHNPYLGLAHMTSSPELREFAHDNRLLYGLDKVGGDVEIDESPNE